MVNCFSVLVWRVTSSVLNGIGTMTKLNINNSRNITAINLKKSAGVGTCCNVDQGVPGPFRIAA